MKTRKARSRPALAALICALALPSVAAGADHRTAELSEICPTRRIVLRSEILQEERTLWVRLPEGYDRGGSGYPVLYLLDAEWHFHLAAADVELLSECSYINSHPIPRLIIVGIVNQDRNRDFTPTFSPEMKGMEFPTSGHGDRFRRFLEEEVAPLIDSTYRTGPYRILAGWSLGGLFTVHSALLEPSGFDAFLAVSPSLWWDDEWILRRLDEGELGTPKDRRLVVTLGEFEAGSMVEASTRKFLERMSELAPPGFELEEVSLPGLGHNYSPQMAFFQGLATIFDDWTLPPELMDRGLAAVDGYYASVSRTYGFPVPVPEDVYGTLGWKLFEGDRKREAGEVFRTWTARRGESPLAFASLGAFYRETGKRDSARLALARAIELEEKSQSPRHTFLLDLRREVEALKEAE